MEFTNNQKTDLIEPLVNFFLNIFKLQSGGNFYDQGEYTPLTMSETEDSTIYELRVQRQGKWYKRRMTIGRLGETSGAKSQCFKVIFDDLLVVKVPPVSVTSFERYLENIDAERKIAENLSDDIECIVPRVSSLLKRIPPFSEDAHLPENQLEKKCIQSLRKNVRFQEYLKINDSFVFCMNLSKHSFLSRILEQMHDTSSLYQKEILQNFDLIWDLMGFEERYGIENAMVFFDISNIYSDFEETCNSLMKKDNISFAVSTYQKKEWFFSRLAGINIIPTASDNYPRDFVETLSTKLDEILEKNKDEISSYQEVIHSYIFSKHFSRIKKSAEGIVSSLLQVIRILRNNNIAIRDLKPDNLYVIADANKSFDFLAKSGEYAIGLIDFETAVILEKNSKGEIDQPLLAGTLYYATPSHLFPNEFLSRIFPDLPRILYLQDWFAMVGIIYNVATGERLFNRTGQLLSKLGKKMQESINENRPPEIVFRKGSQAFWQKALSEYNHNTKEHENILDFINVTIGEEENIVFGNEARISIEKLKRTIKILIHSQKIFRSEKSRGKLINASYNSISKTRSKWEKQEVTEEATPEIRERVILFLKDLEELKLKLNNRMHILEMLNANNLKICLSFLLDFMFETVLMSMYNREWDRLKPDEYRPPDKENIENTITDRQSRSFEQSIDD